QLHGGIDGLDLAPVGGADPMNVQHVDATHRCSCLPLEPTCSLIIRRPPGRRQRGQAAQLSVPSPTARRALSTCTQSCAVMPAALPTSSVHAVTNASAACARPEVALSLVVSAR